MVNGVQFELQSELQIAIRQNLRQRGINTFTGDSC